MSALVPDVQPRIATADVVGAALPSPLGHVASTERALLSANRGRLALTYALWNAENVLRLAQPFVLGLAINGLLESTYVGLVALIAQHLAHLLISSVRRMCHARTFAKIHADLATGLVLEQRNENAPPARLGARPTFARGHVEILEQHVPIVLRAAYSVIGALVMLAWYDWTLLPFCLALVLPAALLNAFYGRTAIECGGRLDEVLEREPIVLERGRSDHVRSHFDTVARWRIRLADAASAHFSLMELFVLGTLVGSLVHYCTTAEPSAGDVFAVFCYVLVFIAGLESAPSRLSPMTRGRDAGLRSRRRG